MTRSTIPAPKMKLYGLVRDAQGRPVIDDPTTLPPQIIAMLTPEERDEFGVTLPNGYEGD